MSVDYYTTVLIASCESNLRPFMIRGRALYKIKQNSLERPRDFSNISNIEISMAIPIC